MDLNKSRTRNWRKNPPRVSSIGAAFTFGLFLSGVGLSRFGGADSGVLTADSLLISGTVIAAIFVLGYLVRTFTL